MTLSLVDVERVAQLARLRLSPEQALSLRSQLSAILGYIDQLAQLDTSQVEPLDHAVDLMDVFAVDQLHTSLDREAALGNAPQRDEECFLVPAVMGESDPPAAR
ncbi:MAG TPA: Asp-tRNA(Asn)/Glu-tRNA(Gln) amidotransferase subunit GatC [Pirellulaceae bacterium]